MYIAPLKALVRERIEDWKKRIQEKLGKKSVSVFQHKSMVFPQNFFQRVVELTGDVTPDMRAIASSDLIVTTPEKWDGVSRSWQNRSYVQAVALLVIDEIHLLGEDRGPVLEVIVSRSNFISSHTEKRVRVVGLSTALANARDLANWLGIKQVVDCSTFCIGNCQSVCMSFCTGWIVQLPSICSSSSFGSSHPGISWKTLLPSNGLHEQTNIRRNPHSLTSQTNTCVCLFKATDAPHSTGFNCIPGDLK